MNVTLYRQCHCGNVQGELHCKTLCQGFSYDNITILDVGFAEFGTEPSFFFQFKF